MKRYHIKAGSLISAETLGANSSWEHFIVQGFFLGLKSLQQCVSTTLKEIYSAIHQLYCTFYQGIQDLFSSMSAIHKAATQVFVECAMVVMHAVRPYCPIKRKGCSGDDCGRKLPR